MCKYVFHEYNDSGNDENTAKNEWNYGENTAKKGQNNMNLI